MKRPARASTQTTGTANCCQAGGRGSHEALLSRQPVQPADCGSMATVESVTKIGDEHKMPVYRRGQKRSSRAPDNNIRLAIYWDWGSAVGSPLLLGGGSDADTAVLRLNGSSLFHPRLQAAPQAETEKTGRLWLTDLHGQANDVGGQMSFPLGQPRSGDGDRRIRSCRNQSAKAMMAERRRSAANPPGICSNGLRK